MFVKPAAGLNVPDPERGGLLAAEGREVEPTTYWHKRIQDKDVDVAPDAAAGVQTSDQTARKK